MYDYADDQIGECISQQDVRPHVACEYVPANQDLRHWTPCSETTSPFEEKFQSKPNNPNMDQVLSRVTLDITQQEEGEYEDVHDSCAHADLMRHKGAPSRFIDQAHENEEIETGDQSLHQPNADSRLQQRGIHYVLAPLATIFDLLYDLELLHQSVHTVSSSSWRSLTLRFFRFPQELVEYLRFRCRGVGKISRNPFWRRQ